MDMDHQWGYQQESGKPLFSMDPTIVVMKILWNLPTVLVHLRRSTLGFLGLATGKRRPCYATHLRFDRIS